MLNFKPDQASGSSSAAVASELTQIKIRLRGEAEKRKSSTIPSDVPHKVRKLTAGSSASLNGSDKDEHERRDIFGRDDVTVRFLWEEEAVTEP